MAFDPKSEKLFFLANGGGTDYWGDGVYEFDLKTGLWHRLKDPCRLTLHIRRFHQPPYGHILWRKHARQVAIPSPDCGPPSARTYDGVQFSTKTGTIFWKGSGYASEGHSGGFRSLGSLWEFNPSRTQKRNGIEPLSWKRLSVRVKGWPTSVELPNGWLLYEANTAHAVEFDPAHPQATVKPGPDVGNKYGYGNLILDPETKALWFLSGRIGIVRIGLNGGPRGRYAAKGPGFGIGGAVRKGKLVLWNGAHTVSQFDPKTKKYTLIDWRGKMPPGHYNHRVYSKWVYLAKPDVFVGISTGGTGVLVYKAPDWQGTHVTTVNPQQFINRAEAGSTVTIPPGLYKHGIYINKGLTIDLKGVRFAAPIQRKGYVVVNTSASVVINHLHVERPPGCHTDCSGLRIEGPNYDVTLRHSTILNQEMGILTGNRGGKLVVEHSNIGNTGPYPNQNLSHDIYVGWSDTFIIRDSVIHGSRRLGHIVKSRAAKTVIVNSKLLGGDTHDSRVVDFPCGGHLIIKNTLLQQSPNTDNPEFINVGGGSLKNCAGHPNRPVYLTMTNDRFVSDRFTTPNEPAQHFGRTGLMHYRGINPPVVNRPGGNIILRNNINVGNAIKTLWYKSDGRGPPPPVSELSSR